MDRHARVGGGVDANQFVPGRRLAWSQLVGLVVEEVDRPADQRSFVTGGSVHPGGDDDVGVRAGEQRLGFGQWLAAPPALDDAGIAGIGQRAGSEVRSDQQGVMVLPADPGLRLRKGEPVWNERLCPHVELAHHGGVRAAAGQGYQREGVVGFDHVGAGPHPVLAVAAGQFVEVDDHLPVRGIGPVVLQRGTPPQPPRVGGVAPEVVQVVPATPYVGDAGVGVENFQRLGSQSLELGAAELGDAGVVALPHPAQGVVAVDVFQPEIGVRDHSRHCYPRE